MRRRTLRQRGGIQKRFMRYKDLEELGKGLIALNREGLLPIPSQKDGICVTDAVTASLWYSDILGEYLWQTYVFDTKGIVDTREVEKASGFASIEAAAYGLLLLTSYRVSRIIESANVELVRKGDRASPPLVQRSESEQGDDSWQQPTGEVCSNVMRSAMKNLESPPLEKPVAEAGGHGLTLRYDYDNVWANILASDDKLRENTRYCAASYDDPFTGRATPITDCPPNPGEVCVALTLASNWHSVACVVIGGVWTFADNEMGFGIPLPGVTIDQIRRGFFKFSYEYIRKDSKFSNNRVIYTVSLIGGQGKSIITRVVQRYSPNELPYQGYFEHVEVLADRKYIFAKPTLIQRREKMEDQSKIVSHGEVALPPKQEHQIQGPLQGKVVESFRARPDMYRLTLDKDNPKYAIILRKNFKGGYEISSADGSTWYYLGKMIRCDNRGPKDFVFRVGMWSPKGEVEYGCFDASKSDSSAGSVRGGFRILYGKLTELEQTSNLETLDVEMTGAPSAPEPESETVPSDYVGFVYDSEGKRFWSDGRGNYTLAPVTNEEAAGSGPSAAVVSPASGPVVGGPGPKPRPAVKRAPPGVLASVGPDESEETDDFWSAFSLNSGKESTRKGGKKKRNQRKTFRRKRC